MTQNYKRKLIRRVEKLLSKSKSPLLECIVDYAVSDSHAGEAFRVGPVTLRDLFIAILDAELGSTPYKNMGFSKADAQLGRDQK